MTAANHFGGLDIVVNDASAGHLGMLEEDCEQDFRTQIETSFSGTL